MAFKSDDQFQQSVNMTDKTNDRQTADHTKEKCVATSGIVCTETSVPNSFHDDDDDD